mmetsp:Transcript_41718/g.66248  ORF Transcript_41718/g.66248 Transcript_41718/m.66248 type:complete len:524 (+) Transcript_41718:689-2260(+)
MPLRSSSSTSLLNDSAIKCSSALRLIIAKSSKLKSLKSGMLPPMSQTSSTPKTSTPSKSTSTSGSSGSSGSSSSTAIGSGAFSSFASSSFFSPSAFFASSTFFLASSIFFLSASIFAFLSAAAFFCSFAFCFAIFAAAFFDTAALYSFCFCFQAASDCCQVDNFCLNHWPGFTSSTRVVTFLCTIQSFTYALASLSLAQEYLTASKPSSASGRLNFVNEVLSTYCVRSGTLSLKNLTAFSSAVKVTTGGVPSTGSGSSGSSGSSTSGSSSSFFSSSGSSAGGSLPSAFAFLIIMSLFAFFVASSLFFCISAIFFFCSFSAFFFIFAASFCFFLAIHSAFSFAFCALKVMSEAFCFAASVFSLTTFAKDFGGSAIATSATVLNPEFFNLASAATRSSLIRFDFTSMKTRSRGWIATSSINAFRIAVVSLESGLSFELGLALTCPPLLDRQFMKARSLISVYPGFFSRKMSNQVKLPSSGKLTGKSAVCLPSAGASYFVTVASFTEASWMTLQVKGSGTTGEPKL